MYPLAIVHPSADVEHASFTYNELNVNAAWKACRQLLILCCCLVGEADVVTQIKLYYQVIWVMKSFKLASVLIITMSNVVSLFFNLQITINKKEW